MPHIRHEVLIWAPVEQVYRALTTQEGLSGWWTPDAQATPERNSVARFPFGSEYCKEMKIMELTSPTQVKWTCITGADEWVGTTLSFILQPGDKDTLLASHPELADQMRQQRHLDGGGTLLILHHDNWKEYSAMFAECNYTWGQFLSSLKLLCETGKGRPWPHQHRTEA